jgi:6-phosphogluconate dehydrogenase
MTNSFQVGMIGLGVMGKNLLLNMADHGFKVVGFDTNQEKARALEAAATAGTTVKGVSNLQEMINLLQTPRKIILLVPAGKAVDDVINSLIPLLQKEDIIIDGGNSHHTDTLRRQNDCALKELHFMGMGVSGGEQGARTGPSIMPGGDETAYQQMKPILESIAAKVNDMPCVAYMGKGASGHYVKMVHNGIEYAIMQLISECYHLLRHSGVNNQALHHIFNDWNKGALQSFLLGITANIFLQKDNATDNGLIDMIVDKAGSKGTGKWTSQDAMNLPTAISVIDAAVTARTLSALKEDRTAAAALYKKTNRSILVRQPIALAQLHDALYFAIVISYAQGLAMLQKASAELQLQIPLPAVVKVWRGGCIIRSALLDTFYTAYEKNNLLSNLLLDKKIATLLKKKERGLRTMVKLAAQNKIPVPALMNSLSYFDAYTCQQLPVNLIQAQRDFFGAHTYERIDKPGSFHTEWVS